MTFEDGKRAIARIYSAANEVAGVGFLVADRYVLTCAHVIVASVEEEVAENPVGAVLSIALPFAMGEARYSVQVIDFKYNPMSCSDDFAILQLVSIPESAIQPIQLAPFPPVDRPLDLQVFGFPKRDEAGRNLTAVARGKVVGSWEQIEDTKQTGLAVEEGFSGAPVWCRDLNAFVGMVVARDTKRPEEKVGFMISTVQLDKMLQVVQQRTLLDILEPERHRLSEQITIAYNVCRPVDLPRPYQTQLLQRLEDLSWMGEGDLKELMLVQFAACLLNQGLPSPINQKLENWAKRYTSNLDSLRVRLQDKQNAVRQTTQLPQRMQSCLLVSVKAHEAKQEHYYVSAWLIREVNHYDLETGRGAEPLMIQNVGKYAEALQPEAGIPCDKIPVLLADYLDQVGDRGIDFQDLTVELLLPLPLMNEPIEQRPIPGYGLPQPLAGQCQVVLRSQERSEGYRALGRWQTKWRRLQESLEMNVGKVLVSDTKNLRQLQRSLASDDVLGLRLTKSPNTGAQGELGVLLSTGAPIALWVRKEDPSMDWGKRLAHQVFCCLDRENDSVSGEGSRCCLEACAETMQDERASGCRSINLAALLQQVSLVRQSAPDLDEHSSIDQSIELAHHLSFVWEDPNRRVPKMTYSNTSL